MYILLEYVTWVILVASAIAALLAVGWICIALVQILYRAAGRLLARSSVAPLSLGSSVFKAGDKLLAVEISTLEERGGLVPRERFGTGLPRDPW
jgi:hypothetical protein